MVVTYNEVIFTIDDKTNSLIRMRRSRKSRVSEVFIPHNFPTGERIDYLAEEFCEDSFDKVIIDEEIRILANAFQRALVNEVVWPKSDEIIPTCCFYNSNVEKVTNIEHVTRIGAAAFYGSDIEEFVWPSGCFEIPTKCFRFSSLKKLLNIDHVTKIGPSVFTFCEMDNFVWPSNCLTVPRECFLGNILTSVTNTGSITAIETNAFCLHQDTGREFSIDLSRNAITLIEEGAFAYCNPENIVMPFYMSENDKKRAFNIISMD